VRRPSPRLTEGIVTHLDRQPVDYDLAIRQWAGYVAALHTCGWATVEVVPPADDCPDGVFVEDTMVVYKNVAVIARPGADARRAEVIDAERTIESLGDSVNRLRPPGILDGGDVLKVEDTVYVGRGGRTNAAGIAQLRDILTPMGATVVAVPTYKVLHLKSAVTALPDGTVLGYPPLVDHPGLFPHFLAVPEESGAHVVLLGGNTVLTAADCPRTTSLLSDLGYQPHRRQHQRIPEARRLRDLPVGPPSQRAAHNQQREVSAMSQMLGVDSEVGQLHQAIVHRPGLELTRLTPSNCDELLFDDVLWADKAREEHDIFAEVLRSRGVKVHLFGDLLAETLASAEARTFVLDRVCTTHRLGPALAHHPSGKVRDGHGAACGEVLLLPALGQLAGDGAGADQVRERSSCRGPAPPGLAVFAFAGGLCVAGGDADEPDDDAAGFERAAVAHRNLVIELGLRRRRGGDCALGVQSGNTLGLGLLPGEEMPLALSRAWQDGMGRRLRGGCLRRSRGQGGGRC